MGAGFSCLLCSTSLFHKAIALNSAVEASRLRSATGRGGAGGLLFFGPLLMILFRQKYPRWGFEWNRELMRFSNRVGIYLALMDDRYPSTDEEQSMRLDIHSCFQPLHQDVV
jgi:hypothetical protein